MASASDNTSSLASRRYSIGFLLYLRKTLPYLKCSVKAFHPEAWSAHILRPPHRRGLPSTFWGPADFPKVSRRKFTTLAEQNISRGPPNEESSGEATFIRDFAYKGPKDDMSATKRDFGKRQEKTQAPWASPMSPKSPVDATSQLDPGFAQFLNKYKSPTHKRVTAGGRIVPMVPPPGKPVFVKPHPRGLPVTHHPVPITLVQPMPQGPLKWYFCPGEHITWINGQAFVDRTHEVPLVGPPPNNPVPQLVPLLQPVNAGPLQPLHPLGPQSIAPANGVWTGHDTYQSAIQLALNDTTNLQNVATTEAEYQQQQQALLDRLNELEKVLWAPATMDRLTQEKLTLETNLVRRQMELLQAHWSLHSAAERETSPIICTPKQSKPARLTSPKDLTSTSEKTQSAVQDIKAATIASAPTAPSPSACVASSKKASSLAPTAASFKYNPGVRPFAQRIAPALGASAQSLTLDGSANEITEANRMTRLSAIVSTDQPKRPIAVSDTVQRLRISAGMSPERAEGTNDHGQKATSHAEDGSELIVTETTLDTASTHSHQHHMNKALGTTRLSETLAPTSDEKGKGKASEVDDGGCSTTNSSPSRSQKKYTVSQWATSSPRRKKIASSNGSEASMHRMVAKYSTPKPLEYRTVNNNLKNARLEGRRPMSEEDLSLARDPEQQKSFLKAMMKNPLYSNIFTPEQFTRALEADLSSPSLGADQSPATADIKTGAAPVITTQTASGQISQSEGIHAENRANSENQQISTPRAKMDREAPSCPEINAFFERLESEEEAEIARYHLGNVVDSINASR